MLPRFSLTLFNGVVLIRTNSFLYSYIYQEGQDLLTFIAGISLIFRISLPHVHSIYATIEIFRCHKGHPPPAAERTDNQCGMFNFLINLMVTEWLNWADTIKLKITSGWLLNHPQTFLLTTLLSSLHPVSDSQPSRGTSFSRQKSTWTLVQPWRFRMGCLL